MNDPAFEQAMSAFDNDDSFDPYSEETAEQGDAVVKKKEATPRRAHKGSTNASTKGMRTHRGYYTQYWLIPS